VVFGNAEEEIFGIASVVNRAAKVEHRAAKVEL
jgi:hypothetical protein